MTGGGRRTRDEAGQGRRLTLTPISFDIVAALGQVPDGLRLSPLAQAIGSPVSSVQAALRILVASGLADRLGPAPPHYRLAPTHPARDHLHRLSLVLPEPAHVIGIVLRASPAVSFACVDAAGFVAALPGGAPAARAEFLAALDSIRSDHPDVPPVDLHDADELARLITVSIGLRDRVREAIVLKGRVPSTPPSNRSRRAANRDRLLVR